MKERSPIIAIDGPVGSGKSTVARELARALGFTYISTGAMYRAVAIAARAAGISPDDPEIERRLTPVLRSLDVRLEGERVLLNGRDVTRQISEPEVGDLASRLSSLAVVRRRLRELQRAAGRGGAVVMEGRDIGTVIFPDADFKFFLDADVEVRAERRHKELIAKGESISRAQVLDQLRERDRRDRERELAPLKRADDAIVIDSTKLAVADVVARMREWIGAAQSGVKGLKPT